LPSLVAPEVAYPTSSPRDARRRTMESMTGDDDVMSLRLGVRLAFGGDTIRGIVEEPGGPEIEFNGWLGLMSAFDTACLRARAAAQADDEGS
jgi:hypothetical protein